MAIDINSSKENYLQIEENYNSILGMLKSIDNSEFGPIADLVFMTSQNISTSINKSYKRIQKIGVILDEIDAIDEEDALLVELTDISEINQNIQSIVNLSTIMENAVKESIKRGVKDFKINTDNNTFIISYTDINKKSQSNFISDYISQMLDATNRIIKVYRGRIALIRIESPSLILEEADAKINTKMKKLTKDIKNMERGTKNSLQEIDKAKEKSKKVIDQIQNDKNEISIAAKSIEDVKASVDKDVSSIITSKIVKRLAEKNRSSRKELIFTKYFYFGTLATFLLCTLAVFIVPLYFVQQFKDLGVEGVVGHMFMRLFLISPAVLLIIFAIRQYGLAVRRSEYYESKLIIASLIDGFKDRVVGQEYKDAVGATVFSELLIDASDYVDGARKRKKEKDSLIEKLVEALKSKTKEDEELTQISSELDLPDEEKVA